jgi:type VI secretion system protein ImpL
MFSLFKKRGFLAVIGLLLLAAFIWWAGPYFAFADYHPLASVTARLIAIGVVIAMWLGSIIWKQVKARMASGKLAGAVVKQGASDPNDSADARQLRERFEEAVAALNQTRGGQNLYELPWYVIIGAPGSGKTTALTNSGLNFPLAQRFGKEALRGVGGTRNCDWWFTDRAVLLDTAGRYTTQDSDQNADSAGWREFLVQLKKYRQRRPLNGVIVAVSASDLMTHTAAEREANIAAVRRRLDELNRELRVQLPVYLLVTKCDLVAGFTEYFDDLTQEGRAQVWGVTFPYEQTTTGAASAEYPAEFDALISRLNARLFPRLEEEREPKRRAAIFGFPQQMAGLKDALTTFVGEAFFGTRFEQRSWLRGVYFTSGTQEGTPIDRLLGAMGRAYAVATPVSTGKGKAYFIERLLRDVLFEESGLAGLNRRLEMRKAAAQIGLYAALALIAVLGVLALSISYSRNKSYVNEVGTAVEELARTAPPTTVSSLDQALPRLNAVQKVAGMADRHREDVPIMMRWGLYQGSALGNAARDAYVRELDGTLLPKMADSIRQRLISYTAEPDKLYEYLKAYLMLGMPQHLDKAQLAVMTDLEWQTAYADQPEIRDALSAHLRNLLQHEDELRALPLDDQLVAQARSAIQQASVPRLMYSRLKLKYAGDTERAVRLDVAAGLGAERVLSRKSGRPLSEPVPALYSPAVFDEIKGLGTAEMVQEFSQDAWVFGDNSGALQNARMAYEVMDVYEQDYIRVWDEILKDVQIASFSNLSQASELLGILAAPNSPLRGFLVAVDQNTFLLKPPDPNAKPGMAEKAEQAVKARLDKLLGTAQKAVGAGTDKPGAQVTAHFDSIHKLVAGGQGAAPIDRVLAQLGQIQTQIASVGGSVGQTNPLEALSRAGGGESLKSLQREAALLPAPIGAMVAQIGGRSEALAAGQARGELDNRYRVQVLNECSAILSGRYPFDPRSAIDVPLADFGRLFGANGVFESFFKENLAPLVDTSRTPWGWRPGASGSSSMLRQFEAAQRIRDQFFRPGGQLPEVRFNVTPAFLDAGSSRFVLELDGQSFEYRHGPERSWPAVWPGPAPGVSAFSFEARAGDRPNQVFQGPWAWFRLLDTGSLQPASDVRYTLDVQAGGHEAKLTIEATSIRNPFLKSDLRQFRCST